jgi:hypothetical protein
MREWLGFKRTPPTLVDAASSVLLEEAAWLPADLVVDEDVCPRIRQLTIHEHRNFRLIGDPELCGLVEVVPAPPPPPSEDDISDPRLVWIIGRLNERERRILRMKARGERTWADAAVSCVRRSRKGETCAAR